MIIKVHIILQSEKKSSRGLSMFLAVMTVFGKIF